MTRNEELDRKALITKGFVISVNSGDIQALPDRCVLIGSFGGHQGCASERQLEPKTMEVLVQLAANANQVVTRAALLDTVWPGVVVGDQVLTRCISKLRQALADSPANPQVIQTIPKRGYRLFSPITSIVSHKEQPTRDRTRPGKNNTQGISDSIVVLPLNVFGAGEEKRFMGAGISRDLTELLARIPGVRVVASDVAERLTHRSMTADQAARELDARFVVDGTLELREPRFRIRLELRDAEDNRQLCARRIDAELSALFTVQDELVQELARMLSTALDVGRVAQIPNHRDFDLEAYEHIHLAEDARRNYGRSAAVEIVEHLTAALAIQPDNGVAHAMLAMQLSQNLVSRWVDDPDAARRAAAEHLEQAHRFAPTDSRVLMAAGIAAQMRGEHQRAVNFLQASLEINPSESHTLAELGVARFFLTRDLSASIDMITLAEKSSPNHPRFGIWAYRRGICYYEAGELAQAVAAHNEAIARLPMYHHIYFTLALVLASKGETAKAAESIVSGLRYAPNMRYSEYETGVLSYGLSIPAQLRRDLEALWTQVSEAPGSGSGSGSGSGTIK